MTMYRVRVDQLVDQYAWFEVEAPTNVEAQVMAIKQAKWSKDGKSEYGNYDAKVGDCIRVYK